jgi:cytochrome c biogenesis protein CcdA
MAFASLGNNLVLGALLLFAFSMGQGLILIIVALFTGVFKKIMQLQKYSVTIMKIGGGVLVLFALYAYYHIFSGIM